MTTHDKHWMAEQLGKTVDWIGRHLDDIPHHRIGASVRFTDADLAEYLRQTAVEPNVMRASARSRRKSA
jgi:hypothetical protein